MRGLFSGTTAKTNEEYRKVIKRRIYVWFLVALIGAATLVIALLARNTLEVNIPERMLGIYTGAGAGLCFGGICIILKDALLLKNEEKLKESRLNCVDERNAEINTKAIKLTAAVILFAMYVVAFVGGLFYPILTKVMVYMIFLCLLVYLTAHNYYSRRM